MADAVTQEKVRVRMYTAIHEIEGDVTITVGYRGRLSDMLNDPRVFVPVSGVSVYDHSRKLLFQAPFLSINKQIVHLVIPIKE